MSRLFEELAYEITPLGTLVLRRRRDLADGGDIYEIKLNDEFLMSSKFTASEEALARLALAELDRRDLKVVVGGLGLGYTAATALENAKLAELLVIDAMQPIIDWHEQGVLPLGRVLAQDPRCRLVHGDFFAMARSPAIGFDPQNPARKFDAILLDIDHSPYHVLHPSNAELYTEAGLLTLSRHLSPGGLFALWSNDPADDAFLALLGRVFGEARAEPVTFHNPLQDRPAQQTVYLARLADES